MPELLAWCRTRLLQPRIALLWLVLTAAAVAADARAAPLWLLLATGFLLVQFRLWDDLMDLPFDRLHAPQRVLVRSRRLAAVRIALAASLGIAAAAFALVDGPVASTLYLLLTAALALVYRSTSSVGSGRSWRTALLLLKYPALLLLLAHQPSAPRALGAAATLYLLLALHEWRQPPCGASG